MPRGYRSVFVAFCGVVAAGLILAVAGHLYKASKQHHPNYDYQPAGAPVRHMDAGTQSPAKPYQPYCENPNSNSDADLCAQWAAVDQVAESNRLSSINLRLAIAAMVLTVVATYFLVRTFVENRRSADAAHDANRPWLELEIVRNGALSFTRNGASMDVEVAIHNRGASPATNVMIMARLFPLHPGAYWASPTGAGVHYIRYYFQRTGTNEVGGTMVFPNASPSHKLSAKASQRDIDLNESAGEGAVYELAVGVRYQFGERIGETVYSFTILDSASPKRPIYGSTDIPPERISLVDTNSGYAT